VCHQAHALKELERPSRSAEENVPATSNPCRIEGYIAAAVFQDAVDQCAVNEVLVVDCDALILGA